MRKLLLFLLTVTLCLAVGLACAETSYQVGDTVGAFTVTDVRTFDSLGADMITLNHNATNATVVMVLNEDTNRTFQIGFRTVAENEHGTPHVFEHATLGGSEKYPSADLFFNLSYQTYNTYMNASTYARMTTYPCSSLSEEQLLKYADFYVDSCFHPLIMEDESLFCQEAWRYQMEDADAALTITGTVYSEMEGAYTLSSAAYLNSLKSAFPGSTSGNEYGGLPVEIPELTWDEVKAYHDKYYHPSNSLTVFYGKLENPEAFLELLDGYFSQYEAREYSDAFQDTEYVPLTESVEQVYSYAAENGTSTDNASEIYYTFVCTGADDKDYRKLDLLTSILSSDSSPLMHSLREVLPSATVSTFVDSTGPEISLAFSATGVNTDDAQLFRDTVDTVLAQITEQGLDSTLVESVAASYNLSTRLDLESSEVGLNTAANISYGWAFMDDLYLMPESYEALNSMVTWNTDGTYQEILRRFTGDNAVTALAVTEPVPGMKEEQDAALAEKLAALKANLNEDEIASIVAESAGAVTTADAEATAAMVTDLTAVMVDSLPEEARIYDIDDTTGDDGVRRIHVHASGDGVGTAMLRMNLGGLDEQQLLWCQLYISLLTDVDTSAHTADELTDLVNRYLYDISVRISLPDEDNEYGYTPYFSFSFKALDNDLLPAFQLMHEILFDSDFSQTDVISGRVSAYRSQQKQSLNSEGYSAELYRMMGATNPSYAVYSHVNGMDYYNFLVQVEDLLKTEPETVTSGLNAVRNYLLATGGAAISAYVGSDEGNELSQAAADAFLTGLDQQPIERKALTLDTAIESEALVLETNTAFNLYVASWQELGLDAKLDADWEVISNLLSDRYLMPLLRDGNGAYGAYAGSNEDTFYLFTYRDPMVQESFDTFRNLGTLLREDTSITQDVLNGYILSSYSSYALSEGELTGGLSALTDMLSGKSQEQTIEQMHALKSVTVADLSAYAEVLDKVVDTGRIATVSSASVITANAALYQQVNDPFGVLTAEPATITDLPEDSEEAEMASWCINNSMMSLMEDGSFGTAETATLGDLALPFYLAVGGDADADAAVAFLAQYGIMPDDPADTPITREQLMTYGCCFLEVAAGMEFPDGTIDTYADAADTTAGLESLWSWSLTNEVLVPEADGLIHPQDPATRTDLARLLYLFFAE